MDGGKIGKGRKNSKHTKPKNNLVYCEINVLKKDLAVAKKPRVYVFQTPKKDRLPELPSPKNSNGITRTKRPARLRKKDPKGLPKSKQKFAELLGFCRPINYPNKYDHQCSNKTNFISSPGIPIVSSINGKFKTAPLFPKITSVAKAGKPPGGIELHKLHHLICERPKRKFSTRKCEEKQDKPMHAHAAQNKASHAQKQFAKELTARLAKLALEHCVNGYYNSGKPLDLGTTSPLNGDEDERKATDVSKTPESEPIFKEQVLQTEFRISRETKCTQYPEISCDSDQETNSKSPPLVATEEQYTQCDNTSFDSENDFEPQQRREQNQKQQGEQVGEQQREHQKQQQKLSCILDKAILRTPEIRDTEESDYEPNKEINESTGIVYGNELDCIDDDKVALEDTESGAEASDSEVSSFDPLQGNGCELAPVIASLFPNTPSVIRFVKDGQTVSKLPRRFRSRLRWRPSAITPNVVKRALKRSHFRLSMKSADWLGYYGNHLKPMAFRPIREFQKVNHFPGSFQLGRKDKLWNNICRLRSQFGRKVVDFVPRTFYLPCDLRLLKEVWARNDAPGYNCSPNVIGSAARPRWILKPPAAARGAGIKVLRQWSDVPKQRNVIVQSYISRPFLIHDTKFDLRLYVYVTGFNPLRAYLHRQGLVRFASQKYSNAVTEIGNRFVHLTNYSINKHNKEDDTGVENHKWKLETLWSYLRDRSINVDGLWIQIKDIIFKTLASVTQSISLMTEQNCRRRTCVHELFGFDILMDADLKPWLLEVNVSPSLHTNTTLDNDVKSAVVTDMFNIAGFRLPPEYRSKVSNSQERTPMDTNLGSEVECHSSTPGRKTLTSSGSSSRSCTPTRSSNPVLSSDRTSQIPVFKANRMLAKAHQNPTFKSSAVASSRGSTYTSKTIATVKAAVYSFLPVSDPKLWDVALTWDERQKQLYHSRVFCREESPLHIGFASLKQAAAHPRGLIGRTLRNNSTSRKNDNHGYGKPALTVLDELRGIVSHLTPDDVRTLVDFVDERYRASMGNFECIFPVGGDPGLQMLIFLEACARDSSNGNLGMRTPTVRYYDLIQYAFLTVYKRSDNDTSSVWSRTSTDVSTITQLPDYHVLQRGELCGEALVRASQMTGIDREGLLRLTELCKRGYHLSGTEAANQRIRWDQNMTNLTKKVNASDNSRSRVPTELGSRRIRNSLQGAKGDVLIEKGKDLVGSILGGAVTFHAQNPVSCSLQSQQHQQIYYHGDSGVGASTVSSLHTTPGRLNAVLSKQSDYTQPGTGTIYPNSHSSSVTSARSRNRSMATGRTNSYAGSSLGETMGWWRRSKSLVSTQQRASPQMELIVSSHSQQRVNPASANVIRESIVDGAYLPRKEGCSDLSTLLDAQSVKELTQSVMKKKRQIEQTNRSLRTIHPGYSTLASKRNLNKAERRDQLSDHNSLDALAQVQQYWSSQVKQKDIAKNEPKPPLDPADRHFSQSDEDVVAQDLKSNGSPRRDSSAHLIQQRRTIQGIALSKRPTGWV